MNNFINSALFGTICLFANLAIAGSSEKWPVPMKTSVLSRRDCVLTIEQLAPAERAFERYEFPTQLIDYKMQTFNQFGQVESENYYSRLNGLTLTTTAGEPEQSTPSFFLSETSYQNTSQARDDQKTEQTLSAEGLEQRGYKTVSTGSSFDLKLQKDSAPQTSQYNVTITRKDGEVQTLYFRGQLACSP